MGLASFVGRWGLMVTSVVFVVGVLLSTSTPSWIETHASPSPGTVLETQFGPFYSRNRTCVTTDSNASTTDCNEWVQQGLAEGDCSMFDTYYDEETQEVLCRKLTAWRVLASFCVVIVLGTAILVAVATCTQCVTCGCCGGSFDTVAMLLCWIEVILSIAAWSLAIATVSIVRNESISDLLTQEASNLVQAAEERDIESVYTEGYFLWGFWLFLVSGTVFGAVSAVLADWASEGSLLSCLFGCLCCCFK